MRVKLIFVWFFTLISSVVVMTQNHPNKYIDSLFNLSLKYEKNTIDSCKIIGEKILKYAEKRNDIDGMALGYLSHSRYYDRMGDYAQSVEYAFKAKKLFDDGLSDNKAILAKILLQIGTMYMLIDQHEISIEYFEEGINIAQRYPVDSLDRLFLLVQIARSKFDLHKNESLEAIVKKVSDIEPSADNTNLLTARNLLLIKIALSQGNLSKTIEYFKEVKNFCSKYSNQFFLAASLSALGGIYFKSNQQDTAIYYANKTIQISQKYNYNRHLFSASELLIKIYNQQNQKDSVLKYLQLKIKANEVLYGKDQLSHLLLIANREKIQKKDIELLEQKNKATTNLLLFGSIGILLILGMLFLSYRNRQKSKINEFLNRQKQNIESKNQELEQTLSLLKSTQAQLIQSEKLASLGELTAGIAHEIQNPLNFVNNFAEVSAEMLDDMKADLQAGKTAEAAEIADDLQVNLQKINHHGQRASAIVKGMLEHSRTGDAMHRVSTDLNALADEYLRLAYHGLRARDSSFNAVMETHFDPDLPKIEVIPQDIGRVLLNLINNAFYAVHQRATDVETLHATSLQYQPTVTIITRKLENAIEISVQDNGKGIPANIKDKIFQPFFTTKPTGQGTGLGLSLAYDIVTKGHGGTLEVNSKVGEGSEFIILLPS